DEVLGEGPPEPAEASVDRVAREPRQRRRDGAPRPPGERGRDRAVPDEVALVDLDEQVEGAAAERLREAVLVVRGVGAHDRARRRRSSHTATRAAAAGRAGSRTRGTPRSTTRSRSPPWG